MDRRHFLATAAALGASAVLPALPARADEWRDAFRRNLVDAPWLAGLAGTDAPSLDCAALEVEGRFPAELAGTLYRIGPARYELGGVRARHWFDGDGMAQAFRIDGARVRHSGRMVETAKYVEETRAGRPLFGGFAARGERQLAGPDTANAANTNILPFAGRLLALWEAGSAWELDPATLAARGPVAWREDLKGMPFSAHPKLDTDGSLWNFGTSLNGLLVLYRIAPDGRLARAEAFAVPELPMIHDFAITARHLVFLLPPLVFERERFAAGASMLESYAWRGEQPMRVLVVDKDDWSRRRWHELPAGFVFHLGNAWEEASGAIRFAYVRSADARTPLVTFRDAMRGEYRGREAPEYAPHFALVTLASPSAAARQELVPGSAEFPRFDARYATRRARSLFGVAEAGERAFGFRGIQRLDLETGAVDRHLYGEGYQAEEHVFVPRARGEGEGWLLGTAFDYRRGVTVLSAFDARHLAAGPVASARLPYGLPLGFHGNFLAA